MFSVMNNSIKNQYCERFPSKSDNEILCPVFFKLEEESDSNNLHQLIKNNPQLVIIDEIKSQLEELIKLRHPQEKLTEKQLSQKIETHLGQTKIDNYGVWVYYPWRNTLVHLLDEKEFVEVRTNRNQYKITPEEEEILVTKKIGIIGLSVGKAIALTMAMERICGEIVLADFDVIELSNLNRIQTGVHHFNTKKTVVAAREIAEIDPYLKVTCYHEGLTEANINDFFTKNKNLDICVEVCDGLEIKILARQKAKELGIPVVMDTNDNGMIDIERFDLETERPIFHGLLKNFEISKINKAISNKDKLPIVNAIVGFENMSERLKKSLPEIGKSILTWPQLASSVVLGGAITCDVCRRIFLEEFKTSGRYFVNLNNIIK